MDLAVVITRVQSTKPKERDEGLRDLEKMVSRNDFGSKVSDKDLSTMIRGVCDGIACDLGLSGASGKRQTAQMGIFKTLARFPMKAKSSRQFVVSTTCELLLARHKDRGAQQIVASNLRLVLSNRAHLEHLLWDHYRRSVASLCRELSAFCVLEESGLEMLIQEMLLCLDLLTQSRYVGLSELKHDLWNCVDSLLYKFQDVSETHLLILSVSESLFSVVFGADYEMCHEMVPSILQIAPKLLKARSKAVREKCLRFLLKMDVYLASVAQKTCPVPLDQDLQEPLEELLQVLKNEYNSSSLQDSDVRFEEEIVLENPKKVLQFLTCQAIAMVEGVLRSTESKVKVEDDCGYKEERNQKTESDLLDFNVRELKSALQTYLDELSESADLNVVLSSTVCTLIVCAVLDRLGTPVGLNSRISDFLALVSRLVESVSRAHNVFFDSISAINSLRSHGLLGDSLCILWDSFVEGVKPHLEPSHVTEVDFDASSPSGKNALPSLRLSLLLNGPLSSPPFLLALFPGDVKRYALEDPEKRLPDLFRHIGQKLLSSYLWDCSPKAKQLVLDLLEIYFSTGMSGSSDAGDLQRWLTREKLLVSSKLLYEFLAVSKPSEYLDLYPAVALCAAQRVESRDAYESMSDTLKRLSSAKSRSRVVVDETLVALLAVHIECLSLLPEAVQVVDVDVLSKELNVTKQNLLEFTSEQKSSKSSKSSLNKILSVKVDDCVFSEEAHFSVSELLTAEDNIKWNPKGPPLDVLKVNWPQYLPCTFLEVVRGLLQLMLKPRIPFEVPLRLVQLKYVLCLFPRAEICNPDNYVTQQLVSCLISFLSNSVVGPSVSHLIGVLLQEVKFKRVESFVADLGEQQLFLGLKHADEPKTDSGVPHLLSLLHPEESYLEDYISWMSTFDPQFFLTCFPRCSGKLKVTLIKSLDLGVSGEVLFSLVDSVCTPETLQLLKHAQKTYSYNWSESRVLSLILGRGLLFLDEQDEEQLENLETDFWKALTSEFLTVLNSSDFAAKYAVEVCLSKMVKQVQVTVPAELKAVFDSGELEDTHVSEASSGWVQKTTLTLLWRRGSPFELLVPLIEAGECLSFVFKWVCLESCRRGETDVVQSHLSEVEQGNHNTSIQKTVIDTLFFVNSHARFRAISWKPEIAFSALSMRLYTDALYFLESDKSLWASKDVQPSYYDIYQNIDDPDLFYGLSFAPCLESALQQLNHENQNLTCFEYESGLFDWGVSRGESSEKSTQVLSHLSKSGMNGLAYSIDDNDVYRWKLGLLEEPVLETGSDDQHVLSQLRGILVGEKPVFSSTLSEKYLGMQYLLFQMQQEPKTDFLDRLQPPDGILDTLQFCSSAFRTLECESENALTLSKLAAVSRELSNTQISKNCAVALQELLKTNISVEAKNVCTISIASCLWAENAVSRTTPVEMLKRLLRDVDPGKSRDLASQFCEATVLLTDWSSQARMISPEQLHSVYISGADAYLGLIPPGKAKTRMFHVFASFCETHFRSKTFGERLNNADGDVERLEGEITSLSRLSQTKELKQAQRVARKALERAKEQKNHCETLRSMFLDSAVQFYLLSAAVEDSSYHEDVTRLISLWFGNPHLAFVNERMQDYMSIPSIKLAPLINQLSSKLSYEPNSHFQTLLLELVSHTCVSHPYQCLYQISSLMRTDLSPSTEKRIQAAQAVWNTVKTHEKTLCRGMEILTDKCVELANAEWPNKASKVSISAFPNGSWWQNGLKKLHLPPPTAQIPLSTDYSDVPTMTKVLAQVTKAGGISHPKIMDFQLSNGSVSKALLKGGKDDMRQDAIMEQVFTRVNQYFLGDPETRKRGLSIRTYNVVPMGPRAGMIEFVAHTESLQAALVPLHEEDELDYLSGRSRMSAVAKESVGRRIEVLEEIYSLIHPVMSRYFFEKFRSSAQSWFRARTNYVRSAAASSMLGYILGIGDRHCNNIMIDYKTGQLVHIDLGISFDQGKNLTVPEKVPFRLTRDMVDAMGSVGVDGPFRRCCELSLELFRQQHENILSILNVLTYDPLYSWTMSPKKKRVEENVTAAICLSGVEEKLSTRLSTEAVVRELISEATSVENLAVIFHGWTPFY
ncbi:Serine/threonine-protein kinase TEL1 [Yarrowia sp. B02]|nr:Serine/threonine-protein kinase TEL1 [Yarrowia sp. B02]